MHILYLHQYFVPPDGIGGTRSYEFARRLVRAGHRVTIITSKAQIPGHYFKGNKKTDIVIDGIDVKALNIPYSNSYSFAKRIIAFSKYIIEATRESVHTSDVDVVFATSTPLTIAIPGLIAKVRHRCPLIFEVRDLWPEVPIAIGVLKNSFLIWVAKRLERMAYRYADRIVALSPGMKRGIVRAGVPENKIEVIPNSADIELFEVPEGSGEEFYRKHPYLSKAPMILYAGTLGLVNGVDYLVDIAAEMRSLNTSVCFVIAGSGKQLPYVVRRAKELGVFESNLWIIPPVTKKEMPQLLSACSIATSFVIDLPELWNNSANKFFDALAASRPIVINHRGWQADLIERTGAGLVVPPHNPQRAAHLLQELISDQTKLSAARQAARSLADKEFDRDRLFEQMHQIFNDMHNAQTNSKRSRLSL